MKRITQLNVKTHRFTFKTDEIRHLLESQQLDYMEEVARKSLQEDGFEHLGGHVDFDFGYSYRDTVLTISI